MTVCLEQRPEFFAYIERRYGVAFDPERAKVIANVRADGSIGAVVLFDHFTPYQAEITVAAEPGGATRALIHKCLDYAFGQLGLARLSSFVSVDNAASLKGTVRLGFRPEGRLRNWFGEGKDAIAFGLCRNTFLVKQPEQQEEEKP